MAFDIENFVELADQRLLEKYCETNYIEFKAEKGEKRKDTSQRFLKTWQTIDEDKKRRVIADFITVDELATHGGYIAMQNEATLIQNLDLSDDLKGLSSRNGVFWFFLNNREVFEEASAKYEVLDTLGWKDINIPKYGQAFEDLAVKKEILCQALIDHFKAELRGEKCIIRYYKIDDLACFVAYIQDWATEDSEFDLNGKLGKAIHQPVIKIFFVYEPARGRLSVKAKEGGKKIKDLQKIFAESVLGQEINVEKNNVFNLNKFKDFTFDFPTPQEDEVENIFVKSLRISYPQSKGIRILIETSKDKQGEKLNVMHEAVKEYGLEMRINTDSLNITQASIRIKFPKPAKGLRGTVTAHITHPNSWDLGNKPLHRKVKKYLKDWGIDNGNSAS